MKKILISTAISVLVLVTINARAQSVFLQQYSHLPLKKIALINDNIIASDGNSFYINDKNGKNVNSVNLSLSGAYLLQQMVTSSDGNIFCLYQYSTGSAASAGMVILSLDANLNLRWMKDFSNGGSAFGYGMTSTDDNGVVICGTTCSTGFFLLKLNSEGTQIFIKNVNMSGFCVPYAITNYKTSQFAIATRMQSGNDNEVIFIADNSGNVISSKSISFSNSIYIKSIKADLNGNIYSLVNESDGTSDITKLASDLSGTDIYHISSNNQSIQLNDLAYSNPNVLVVGNINIGGSSNLNILTIAISTSNNNVISKISGNVGYNDAYSVISDNDQRFYMSGTATVDGYIAKVNSDMTGFCNTNSINPDVIKQSKTVVDIAYTMGNGAVFNEAIQQTSGTQGISAISGFCDYQEIASDPNGVEKVTASVGGIGVYPNPASNELNVTTNMNESKPTKGFISDVLGRRLISIELINGVNKIDISTLSSGEYYISLIIDNQIVVNKFIKAQ